MSERINDTMINDGLMLIQLQEQRMCVRVKLIKQQMIVIRAVVRAIEQANPIDHKADLPEFRRLE